MKYPIMKCEFIPYGYKHSTLVDTLHIDFNNESADRNYLAYAKKGVIEYLNGFFIATSPLVIQDEPSIIIAFRSNIDKRALQMHVNKILQEIKYHTQNKVQMSYGMDRVLLLQEGQNANMLQIHKVGEEYTQHATYTKSITTIADKHDNKNVNYLLSVSASTKNNE